MKEKAQYNVLMTGAGAPGAAGIIRCLQQDKKLRLTVCDAATDIVGKHLSKDFVQVPKAEDKKFIPRLLEICKQKKIDVILPLVTKELLPLSKNLQKFKDQKTGVMVSSEAAIKIANNKIACYNFLQEKGIAVPDFLSVKTAEEFKIAARELGYPKKEFWFKPGISNGSRGFRVVSDVINESDQLFNHKPYNTYIKFAAAARILSAQPFPELLVSEYLPGHEYSVDCLAENGKAKLIIPRLRTKMINGISVAGEFVNDTSVINYCTTIIEAIGLNGNIGIQIKLSAKKQPLLLEINPRVQGTIVAALGAGVNLPLLGVKQLLQLPIKPLETKVRWGTKFLRYWTEVYY